MATGVHMAFHSTLESFVAEARCSTKRLADEAGLSPSAVSRYRNGQRVPTLDSNVPARLAAALARLGGLDEDAVRTALLESLLAKPSETPDLPRRFDLLCGALGANMAAMARRLNYDASYLSRIRSGKRRPADPASFARQVAAYVRQLCGADHAARERTRALVGATEGDLEEAVALWLLSDETLPAAEVESVRHFMDMLDGFDLDDYIRAIRFDELKVPTAPFQLPTSRTYYGLEGRRQAELDFAKACVLSKSTAPVLIHSDMGVAQAAADPDFSKKWMYGLAMMIKKGHRLNVIHDLDRPFAEMMLGLEAWVPLYMTGQVSPWYFKGCHDEVYRHMDYVSGTVALTGECVGGSDADGLWRLTNSKADMPYFHRKAELLLKHAVPAMEVYRAECSEAFWAFLDDDAQAPGPRHSILTAPPLYVLSDEQVLDLLRPHGLAADEVERVCRTTARQRERIRSILATSTVQDEVLVVGRDEFLERPVSMPLTDALVESGASYTWEQYCAHLDAARAFAHENEGYELVESDEMAFRNISLRFRDGHWALVSKNRAPAVHFVIRHPALLDALERFAPPVWQ